MHLLPKLYVPFLIALSYLLSGSDPSLASTLGGESPPNILLVLSDDHSIPHLAVTEARIVFASDITPNLDRFAQRACDSIAPTPLRLSAPSRISIFAGQSPVGLGVTRFAQPPRGDVIFFTDILRSNGYWVGLDGRHQHLDGRAKEATHIDSVLREEGMQNLSERFDHFVRRASTKGEQLDQVTQQVTKALNKVPEDKPFFLYFGFNQPHRGFSKEHEEIDPKNYHYPKIGPIFPR